MNSHREQRLPREVLERATHWFIEFQEREPAPREREEFVAWLRTSPEHVRAYLRISANWEDAPALAGARRQSIDELVNLGRSRSNVVDLGRKEPTAAIVKNRPRDINKSPRWYFAIAAAAGACVVAAVMFVWHLSTLNTFETLIGEQRHIVLADGSSIDLDASSSVRVHFSAQQRSVQLLEGQALFRVAQDAARPFIVDVGGTSVRAVGTVFDVYRRNDATTVTVVEGRVAVSRASNSTPDFVDVGEQVTLRIAQEERLPHADVTAATAWMQQKIILRDTPLIEVATQFNRYNRRKIVIVDSGLNGIRISGEFASADSASLVKGLAALGRFRIRELPDRVEIAAK